MTHPWVRITPDLARMRRAARLVAARAARNTVAGVARGERPPVVRAGTLRLGARSFARQLTTMRGRPGALTAFGLRFARRLPLRAGRS